MSNKSMNPEFEINFLWFKRGKVLKALPKAKKQNKEVYETLLELEKYYTLLIELLTNCPHV